MLPKYLSTVIATVANIVPDIQISLNNKKYYSFFNKFHNCITNVKGCVMYGNNKVSTSPLWSWSLKKYILKFWNIFLYETYDPMYLILPKTRKDVSKRAKLNNNRWKQSFIRGLKNINNMFIAWNINRPLRTRLSCFCLPQQNFNTNNITKNSNCWHKINNVT